jgi:hypothetical protein
MGPSFRWCPVGTNYMALLRTNKAPSGAFVDNPEKQRAASGYSFLLFTTRDDGVGHVLGHDFVVIKLHGEAGAPFSHRAQVGRIAEHLL